MNQNELNTQLYEKTLAEQEQSQYKESLMTLTPKEILDKA